MRKDELSSGATWFLFRAKRGRACGGDALRTTKTAGETLRSSRATLGRSESVQ